MHSFYSALHKKSLSALQEKQQYKQTKRIQMNIINDKQIHKKRQKTTELIE